MSLDCGARAERLELNFRVDFLWHTIRGRDALWLALLFIVDIISLATVVYL